MTTRGRPVRCTMIKGSVAAAATFLSENARRIIHSAQFGDLVTGNLFIRISFQSDSGQSPEALKERFGAVSGAFAMEAEFFDDAAKRKSVIMGSRFGHCLSTPLYRWRSVDRNRRGEFESHGVPKLVMTQDIPFHCIKTIIVPASPGSPASPTSERMA